MNSEQADKQNIKYPDSQKDQQDYKEIRPPDVTEPFHKNDGVILFWRDVN